MSLKLRVDTKTEAQEGMKNGMEETVEPMSPISEHLIKQPPFYIFAVFESEISTHLEPIYDALEETFIHVHPRFSCIPIEDEKGKKHWKRVEVNVKDHVKIPLLGEGLSEEEYSKHLDDYIPKLAKETFSQQRPLWELHAFKYPTKNAAATFIFKIHHAIADGISLMGAVFSCFKRADDPSLPLTFPGGSINASKNKPKSHIPKILSSLYYPLSDFVQSVRLTFFEDDRTPIRSGNAILHPHSIKVCTTVFPLDVVKTIKAILGVTVNDVLVGMIFLGIRLYMQEMDQKINETRTTATMAINLRTMKGVQYALPEEMLKNNTKVPWGNRLSSLEIPVPNLDENDLANPLKFVTEAHQVIQRKRNSYGLYLMGAFLYITKTFRLYETAARIVGRSRNSSLSLSNLIGPTEQMSFWGHPVKDFYFLPIGLKVSLTVSMMSYMEKIKIGFIVEEDFIDQQRLVKCVEKAFDLINQAATAISE